MVLDKHNLLAGLDLPDGPVHAPVLGELELDVMESLWEKDCVSAQQIHSGLNTRKISLSTVQSTLERLVRKKLLRRSKLGRAFIYSTVIGREQLIGLMIQNLASRFANDRITPMVSGFCAFVEKRKPKSRAKDLAVLLRSYIENKDKS